MIKVSIPGPFRKHFNEKTEIHVEVSDLNSLLNFFQKEHPSFAELLLDESGAVRSFVNVFINEEDARFLEEPNPQLKTGDQIDLIAAVSGG